MARKTARWFLSLQTTLFLLLIFVRGNEDAEDEYKNGRNLVLEYFLPINLPAAVDPPARREKRDVEGSGEEETVLSEISSGREADNATENAFAKLVQQQEEESDKSEGSGEIDEASSESSEFSSEEKSDDGTAVPILGGGEVLTTTEEVVAEGTKTPEVESENLTSTEMIFDKSEDFEEISTIRTEETATDTATISKNTTTAAPTEAPATLANTTTNKETTIVEEATTEVPEGRENEVTTAAVEELTTGKPQTTVQETTTTPPSESVTIIPHIQTEGEDTQTTVGITNAAVETTTTPPVTTNTTTETPTVIPVLNLPGEKSVVDVNSTTRTPTTTTTTTTVRPVQETAGPSVPPTVAIPKTTEVPSVAVPPPTTPEPVVEEIFQETKVGKKLEALPGNILQKENLSLAADPLLIVNTRLMDSEENVQLSSSEPKRLGAYIVIGLILLSFSSLVGYITFRKRMNRKRQEFESNQESHDTEKALLSLSDYKDNSELEENHLKNNEITPIVVKSNSQINKFEKNTNFSSPKNLNTIANEKNIEKDNVLKSTAENLTQVIIEDSPKDVEEEKNVPNLEKLIVKTRIDQDSIPKKPIIINRSSAGYLPIPQDNS